MREAKDYPPVVTFRQDGHDKFTSLLMLLLGSAVIVTYVEYDSYNSVPLVVERYGVIDLVSEEVLWLSPYGVKKGNPSDFRVHIRAIKMVEVV